MCKRAYPILIAVLGLLLFAVTGFHHGRGGAVRARIKEVQHKTRTDGVAERLKDKGVQPALESLGQVLGLLEAIAFHHRRIEAHQAVYRDQAEAYSSQLVTVPEAASDVFRNLIQQGFDQVIRTQRDLDKLYEEGRKAVRRAAGTDKPASTISRIPRPGVWARVRGAVRAFAAGLGK